MHIYSFEKLEVWLEARKLVQWVYKVTNQLPSDEKFGLVSQMRRSSISVVSNLAEGSARNSSRDKANFYQFAYSSLIELLNQLIICNDLEFIPEPVLLEGRSLIEVLTRKVSALRNSQLENKSSEMN